MRKKTFDPSEQYGHSHGRKGTPEKRNRHSTGGTGLESKSVSKKKKKGKLGRRSERFLVHTQGSGWKMTPRKNFKELNGEGEKNEAGHRQDEKEKSKRERN